MGARAIALALALVLTGLAGPGRSQEAETAPRPQLPLLTIDQDRLFRESLWGQRAVKRIEEASAQLASENRGIEEDLSAEERRLTDERPKMAVDAFRSAADAFDTRVTEIRREQDAKERGILQVQEAERQRFYQAALPVMGEVLRKYGALAVLDSRTVFLAVDAIDVTDEMIREIDTRLGPGGDQAPALPAPEPEPPANRGTAPPGDAPAK